MNRKYLDDDGVSRLSPIYDDSYLKQAAITHFTFKLALALTCLRLFV